MVTKRKKSHELTAAVLLDVVGWEHTLTAVKLSLPPSLLLFGDQFDDVSSLECKFILMLSSIGVESLELWPSVLLGLFSACSRTSAHQLDIGCREPANMLLPALGSLRKNVSKHVNNLTLRGASSFHTVPEAWASPCHQPVSVFFLTRITWPLTSEICSLEVAVNGAMTVANSGGFLLLPSP